MRKIIFFPGSLLPELFFFLSLFLLFLIPPTDPDLGWHLRCGEEFLKHHNFCQINHFSLLLPNYFWSNNRWLYEILIYLIYNVFGLWGLTVLNAVILTVVYILFYYSFSNFRLKKMIAIVIMISFSWSIFSFGIRNQLIGLLFLSLTLFYSKKLTPIILPLIILLWANFHGSFILGLILVAFFSFRKMLFARSRISSFLTFFLSLAVTFLNPVGYKIYEEAARHYFGNIDLSKLIAEWVPPNEPVFLLILFSAFFIFVHLLCEERMKNRIFAFLILPFAYLSLKARRDIPFYFLIFFYLFLTSPLTNKLLKPWIKNQAIYVSFLLFLSFSLLAFSGPALSQTVNTNSAWQNYCQSSSVNYPCQAVNFLKNYAQDGNIFNRYEWGGFLIWQLPNFKVFVDGRMPAWSTPEGKSPYTIYLETLQTKDGWQETLKKYTIDFIFISPGTFMDLLLKDDPGKFGWKELYRDRISVIYQSIN